MKKYAAIIFVAIIWLTQQNAKAQMYMGVYGMRTNSINTLASPNVGGGFGMNFLSKGDTLGYKNTWFPKVIQFGGNYYYSGLGQKTFYDVPLLAPQMGQSKVILSNAMFTINAMTRFSFPNHSVFTPYVDLFGGYRGMYSNLTVIPYLQYNTQTQSKQSLASVRGLNYGIGGGILTSLGKRVKLDIGVSYSESIQSGNMVDLNSAYADANGINLNLKNAPKGIMMVNVGLVFYLDGSSVTMSKGCDCNPTYYNPVYSPPVRNSNGNWGGGSYSPPSHSGGTRSSGNWGGGSSWGGGGNFGGSNGGGGHVGIHVGGGGGRAK